MNKLITKQDIVAIRKADDICVHIGPRYPDDGIVRLIKRRDYSVAFSEDREHILPATVELYGMRGQDELKTGQVSCFASTGLYHSQQTQVSLALKSLRAGDELTFVFWPDARSNGYTAAAGLHGDVLYMHVGRNGKTIARWEIAHSMCPSNSARMCRGVPNSDSYNRDAAEARKVA